MTTQDQTEERLALFIDHENVAIGARDIGLRFDVSPLLEALAERGRLITRRAYADWNLFREDRRGLVDGNIELIEIPQRSDSVRKNAADIQMAVDAMELALTRDFVSTFVIVSGDSDFTPLVSKLRELNKRVIGVGMKGSTSGMLPPSCDEFIFYDRLDGAPQRSSSSKKSSRSKSKKKTSGKSSGGESKKKSSGKQDLRELERVITRTLSGMQSTAAGAVQASNLKRALLRKDPTFAEGDYGFRGFQELLRHLESNDTVKLTEGSAPGDPEVDFPESGGAKGSSEQEAFDLLRSTVIELMAELGGDPPLSGLKDQLRKRQENFSEKDFGYGGFLQFCKAAVTKDVVEMDWEEDDEEYYLYVPDDELPDEVLDKI
ncbi:NYN domain-containing protein [Salsipaludibacter albus]|uniref:NYN domain-containing protein n=1 Tax=Salsipaludibacter albus TaxID=2849650 RepID=UPI001EE46ED5|nr:NYN domain-containing protein [Salsipaludibacter albus]MBY5163005.1 NYN domain-containing protein [Salsipaludibacter albus]